MVNKTTVFRGLLLTLVLTSFILALANKSDVKVSQDLDDKTTSNDLELPEGEEEEASSICGGKQWKSFDPDTMQPEEIFKYFRFANQSACSVAYDFGGKLTTIRSLVGIDGQKTVCMDPGVVPDPKRCLVYSFGINNEWSFDEKFEKYGCQVYSFDPSMSRADGDYRPNIHFFRLGLSGSSTDHGPKGWKMRTLDAIYAMLEPRHGNDAVIDYLKVDIEGSEWDAFRQIVQSGMLDKVKQIAAEIHLPGSTNLDELRAKAKVLKSLEDHGMVRFSSRANIWMTWHLELLNRKHHAGYEITWYNQKFVMA